MMQQPFYAIVTGAGSGLGAKISTLLTERGIPTVIVGRTFSKLTTVAKAATGAPCLPVTADITQENQIGQIFAAGESLGLPLGLIIHCAGQGVFGPVGSYNEQAVREALDSNLLGTILVGQQTFQKLKETGGTMVFVMSTAALAGKANESVYCAAKWGVRGFVESLRAEAKSTSVNILSVYPGGMKTPFWSNASGPTPDPAKFMDPREVAETILANVLGKETLAVTELTINRPAR